MRKIITALVLITSINTVFAANFEITESIAEKNFEANETTQIKRELVEVKSDANQACRQIDNFVIKSAIFGTKTKKTDISSKRIILNNYGKIPETTKI